MKSVIASNATKLESSDGSVDWSDLLTTPKANELLFIMHSPDSQQVILTLEHRYRDKTQQRYQQVVDCRGFASVKIRSEMLEIIIGKLKDVQKQFELEDKKHGIIEVLN